MEAMNSTPPAAGFLESVKDLAHRNGALFALDEMITGFRYANGGAQEYFDVVPDLATFGKGLANGYPLSAIVGRADVMRLMEEIFFSFTFGGETLSLAAARAVLAKMTREPVVETIRSTGQALMDGTALRIERHGIERFARITGHPSWSFLAFDGVDGIDRDSIKTLFLQEIFARGILSYGTHNMTYAHTDDDVAQLLSVYDEVFSILADAVARNEVDARLRCEPLVPLFAVR
jgi:glutamate-1-semialdehyde 2,1-aminomutase